MPSYEVDVNFNTDTGSLEEASEELARLKEEASEEVSVDVDADGVSEELDEASESVDNLGNSLSTLEAGALLGIADQLSSIGSGAEGMAQQLNTASISMGQLATNTGIAEPQLTDMINYISNATFPRDEAIAYANALNQMGVSADQLGDSATNMDKINDATGIGYQKTMQLTQGLQSVGVSANNLPSSFNAIAYAQANVNGGADTLSTVLKRQASTLNEYGLSVDQTVLIMQKLSEQGVQGMKMGSELSNVLKENNGDISAIEQSLGMASGTLENATSTTSAYEGQLQSLADEEAEHKTLVDQLGAMWEDVSTKFAGVLAPLGSAVGLFTQLGSVAMSINAFKTLGSSLKELTIVESLSNSFGTFKAMLTAIRTEESLGAGIKSAYAIAMGTQTTAEAVDTPVKTANAGATGLLATAEWGLLAPLLIIGAVILGLIAVMWYLYNNNEQVRESVDALISAFQGFISKVTEALQPIITFVQQAVSWFFSLLSQVGAIMLSFVAQWMINWVTALTTGINIVTQIVTGIGALFNQMRTNIQTALMLARVILFTVVGSWRGVISTVRGVVSGITNAFNGIRSAISGAMSGVQRAISAPFTSAYNTVKPIIDNIKKAWDMLQSVGMSGYEGWSESSIGYEGWDDNALNGSLSQSVSQNTTSQVNNFNINGIIEEEASRYIVDSVNSELRRQRLIRGV